MALTKFKAKKILSDKSVRGKKLTGKQKRFFGFVAGGGTPTSELLRQKGTKRS